jgi:hypothetical protein
VLDTSGHFLLVAITIYLLFPSWDDLLLTLAFAKPPPMPP